MWAQVIPVPALPGDALLLLEAGDADDWVLWIREDLLPEGLGGRVRADGEPSPPTARPGGRGELHG